MNIKILKDFNINDKLNDICNIKENLRLNVFQNKYRIY